MASIAKETGWSYHDILWVVPASAALQIYDVCCYMQGADLRWATGGVDIDEILNG